MVTLAPELENSTEVIKHLTSNGVTVSLGKLLFHMVSSVADFILCFCSFLF